MHMEGISEIATFSFPTVKEWFANYSFFFFFDEKYLISNRCAYITTAKHDKLFLNRHGVANAKWPQKLHL